MEGLIGKSVFPGLLVVASVILALANFTPGTFLSGWDTLQPELNLGLYLQRIFWGVWQEHQGLGAVAAQAHPAELARLWYLLPAQLLPQELFRHGYFWVALILGPLGVYFLLKKFVRSGAAFMAGLFYLLNLGTMQHFYLPLEMFATAYAFLPWLFWAVISRKTWVLALAFFLAAPMAHTPTLFFINFAALALFALVLNWRWGIRVLLIGLIVNSFWLLPSFYFILNHGLDVANSHISQQFTPRAVSVSSEFANLGDLALIKGYLFDWGHYDFSQDQFADLLTAWKNHLSNPTISTIGYGLFILVAVGVFPSLRQKDRDTLAIMPVSLLALIVLLDLIPWPPGVVSEALRFPFTKFSLLLMLSFAFYFGIAVNRLPEVISPTAAILLIFYTWPAFTGNLICNCVRVKFPTEYQQVFDWFGDQDHNTRIAPFPMDSIYGWGYYGWGYEGAGFRWFGLAQPILDREFDRWMPTNENYYWEASYALYSKNLPLFESVLAKYRVNWLLVDKNIINPSSPKALFFDELAELINRSKKINLAQNFGKIDIYRIEPQTLTKDFISLANDLPEVGPTYKWGDLDQAYLDFGDYTSTDTKKSALTADLPGSANGSLKPGLTPKGSISQFPGLSSRVWTVGESSPSEPGVNPDLEPFTAHTESSIAKYFYPYRSLFTGRAQSDLEFDPAEIPLVGEPIEVKAPYSLPSLPHNQGYLITVESKNISGKPLLFWLENLNNRRADLETYLPATSNQLPATSYFVQPPMAPDGLGYTLHFDNTSPDRVTIAPIDYWSLVTRHSSPPTNPITDYQSPTTSFLVDHPNPSFYRIDLTPNTLSKDTTIILNQSFSSGWVAISVDSKQGLGLNRDHVLANNWANGWRLEGSERIIYILFWPQLLEFAGFGLLIGFLGYLLTKGLYSSIIEKSKL